ncbi:MAG: putative sporulation protein YtxC [Ruminococcaceae bacterium]|nr:putative sporulation protein YtxC [Oscillospiraceae bacterium]
MFDRITLGVNGDTNLIKSRLYNHPECTFPISVAKDASAEAVTYISFEPSDDLLVLDRYLNVVAEYIIERYETRMIRRILEEDYSDLSILHKREILKNVACCTDDPEFGYNARKQAILLSMYDYFKEESLMLIEGFVTFRLKEYEALLAELTERLVEAYIAQREYEEFIELLKYFVNIQQPRPALVHVCVRPEGGYTILDEKNADITSRCFSDFVEGELLLTEEAYDDLLISVLITLAPEKISVHGGEAIKNRELFTTITRVFEDKVSYCPGCALCQHT